ncbi:MAG: stage III sporulation protein AE [Christensenellales bacterium]|jgi:stage III sporulation protein AE
MRRWICLLLVSLILCAPWPVRAAVGPTFTEQEDPISEGVEQSLDSLDLSAFERALAGMSAQEQAALAPEGVGELLSSLARGETALDGQWVLSLLGSLLSQKQGAALGLLSRLLALALLSSLASGMGAFKGKPVGEAAVMVCCVVMGVMALSDLAGRVSVAADAIGRMSAWMQAVFPALAALLVAVGGAGTAAFLQPALAALPQAVGAIFSSVVTPLLMASGAVSAVSCLSERVNLSKLSRLLKNGCTWLIGLCMTLFAALVGMQSLSLAGVDAASLRAARYAVGTAIPVVGGTLAETLETLASCSLVVKNVVGVAGFVALLVSLLGPALDIWLAIMCYKVAAAVLQPLSGGRVGQLMDQFAGVLTVLLGILVAMGAMFMMMMALLVGACSMVSPAG